MLRQDYEPLTKLKSFKITQRLTPISGYDQFIDHNHRFEGEVETYQPHVDISGEGYSIYLQSRWATGEPIQLAYLDVCLSKIEAGKYKLTADRFFHIQEGSTFWDKIERLQQADKNSHKAHEGYQRNYEKPWEYVKVENHNGSKKFES